MIIVFSDLDGTLLDHDGYSFEAAKPALALLAERQIPLVLASSKTEAEMLPIAQAMGLAAPMIVENGGGVVGLNSFAISGAAAGTADNGDHDTYAEIRHTLRELPKELTTCFEGFGDWDDARVTAETGLPQAAASRARQRRFSEPGHFTGTDAQRTAFLEILDAAGFMAVQGGRFFTLMPKTSKAARMSMITEHYGALRGEPVRSIALGDAPNDLAMLQAADCGVIIANPSHPPLPETERERQGFILRSLEPGPEGWNRMIHKLVQSEFF